MSETSKTAETAKKAQDNTVRPSQADSETAGKTARDSMNESTQNAAQRAKEASQSMADTIAETAEVATNMSSQAAEQSRDVMLMGVRTAADVGSRVADISFGRGHHFMSSAAHAMDVYRDASEQSAERVQALFASAMTLGRGLQHMQHAWLEIFDHTIENATHKPQDLLRCKNITEMAEVQRDLYIGAINHAFESTTRLLDMAGRAAQDAVRPLQVHPH
jgi:hypothetical protein